MPKNLENMQKLITFIAQTVIEDGKIPHFTPEAVRNIVNVSEEMASHMDGERNALTLRLRELGGLIRIAGDIAVQEDHQYVETDDIVRARTLSRGIDLRTIRHDSGRRMDSPKSYGDYFF
jgi:predicted ATP-dependent protease